MEYSVTLGDATGGQEIITLAQAKANSKIDYDDEDTLLQTYIDGIVPAFESFTGTHIYERAVTVAFSCWQEVYDLPVFPVQAVTALKYVDTDGDEQTVADAEYKLYPNTEAKKAKLLIKLDSFPDLRKAKKEKYPVIVELTVGYADGEIPGDIVNAALLHFGSSEMFREDKPDGLNTSKISTNVQSVLRRYKIHR